MSVGSALYAFPAVVITTLDLPIPVKLFWLLCLLVPAGLITWFILERPHAAPRGQSRVRGILKRAVLPLAAVASIIASLLSVRVVEMHVPLAAELGCVAVGSGNQDYAAVFQEAYTAAGGEAKLGCAVTPVTLWGGGYQQTLQGLDGQSVITALDPAHVIILDADEYQGFLDIAGQGASFIEAGYPLSGKILLHHGSEILLGGGDPDHTPSALLKQNNGQWYWVSSSFWATYLSEFGGPTGSYGYPISKQVPFDNGIRQFFQHGWLFYRADVGVLTAHQYELFRAGKLHPAPTPAAFPSIPPSLKVADVYDVDSNHGVSYDLKPNQYAEQAFKSTLPYVDQMGVIVGLNPLDNFHPQQHYLRIQILTSSGKSISSEIAPLANNVNTVARVPDVRLKPGIIYYIRVTNLSLDVLGVYLNDPHRKGENAGHYGNAVVNGIIEPGVLSAFVEARSIRN